MKNLNTQKNLTVLDYRELKKINGGMILPGPIPLSAFFTMYSSEIGNFFRENYEDFIAGITGKPES